MTKQLPVALGIVLLLVSAFGLLANARAFDRANAITHVPSAREDAWTRRPDGQFELRLDRHDLPSPGTLSASVCPEPVADPAATLVTEDAPGHEVGHEKLAADDARGKKCFEAVQKVDHAGALTALLRVPNEAARRSIRRVTVQASRRITPRAMWPVAAMVLGFLVLAAAPPMPDDDEASTAIGAANAAAGPPAGPFPPASGAQGFIMGGIVPPESLRPGEVPKGFGPGETAESAAMYHPPPAPAFPIAPATPLVDRIWSPALALGIYLAVHVPVMVVATIYLIAAGKDAATTGTFVALTTVVQHGMLALGAVWMLGAFGARDARKALGIVPMRPVEALIAVVAAAALILVAATSTHFIKDAGESPMGEMIQIVPVRYVIAFGALLAPFSEELFFRGVLVRAFARWGRSPWNQVIGVLGSAVVFTGAHVMQLQGAWAGLVPIAMVGLVNGVLRVRSGGITQPWLVHTLYNGALSVGLYFGG